MIVARCIHCAWQRDDSTVRVCPTCGAKLVALSEYAVAAAKQRYDAYRAWSMEAAVIGDYERR